MTTACCVFFILAYTYILGSTTSGEIHQEHGRLRRKTVKERVGCSEGADIPTTRVNTTSRLEELRAQFPVTCAGAIHAYIVPSEDAHQSEYPSAYDQRRGYLSGFTGTAGTAVVTTDRAALWTDARYFLEAEDTLDCNWILMKQKIPGYPSVTSWLKEQLHNITNARVGANPFLMNARTWKTYENELMDANITLVGVTGDLVDMIWNFDRPEQPNSVINELPLKFSGKRWQDKVSELRDRLKETDATAYVLTSLDETAWLFNLRASDIKYNPFFLSYAIVEANRIRLYILNHTSKLNQEPTDSASTRKLYEHLDTSINGSCLTSANLSVEVLEYDNDVIIFDLVDVAIVDPTLKIWISLDCNQAIYAAIPQGQRLHSKSPIILPKITKNVVEQRGMRNSHIRDAVALIKFMDKLERGIKAGEYWSEMSAALELNKFRGGMTDNRGISFETIAGYGSNGAIIHYSPTNATDKQITTREMFLLDSGGQYLDGTTDVTRTFHFGSATPYEKECYTRVLIGHINIALLKWPKGFYASELDILARTSLWDVGLRYRHGTGHGIGSYLGVHERPYFSVSSGLGDASDEALDEAMYISDEPGYYEEGQFGIRLESILKVERARTKYSFPDTEFLGFKPVTLVPYEPHLIDFSMLGPQHKQWLVEYHNRIKRDIVPHLSVSAQEWTMKRVKQFSVLTSGVSSPSPSSSSRDASSSSTSSSATSVFYICICYLLTV